MPVGQTQTFVDLPGSAGKRQRYQALRVALATERSTFINHWRDIGDFISPRRQRYFVSDVNKGDRRNFRIMDGSASIAARTLSAGMMGGITSPARDWFKLSVEDQSLSDSPGVKTWLDEVTRIMRTAFNNSDLYQTLPAFYNDMGVFGTAAMMAEEDFENVVRFYSFPIGSYMIANDSRGRPSVFLREFRLSVRQIVQKFQRTKGDWSNISDRVRDAWTQGRRDEWIDVCHLIQPNDEYDMGKSKSNPRVKKFSSDYWEASNIKDGQPAYNAEPDGSKFLRESGYDLFPVMIGRWQLAAEDVYGTDCPGMMALGDAKQLQLGEKRIMQAIEKVIDPPMKGPESMRSQPATTIAGGLTFVEEGQGRGKFEPVHTVDPRITEMENKQTQKRQLIDKAFHVDTFLMISNDDRTQPATAEEIIEKRSEKMLAIGPVLSQLDQDVLNPLIEIVFEFLDRQGQIPQPPPELAGSPLKVDYISILAQAQKIMGVVNVERFTKYVVDISLNAQKPDMLDNIDWDTMIAGYADALGVPQKYLNTKDMIDGIRQQRAQQQQQAAAVQQASDASQAAKNLAGADMKKDSLLSRMVSNGAGVGAGQGLTSR